ncbi:hypothetical protein M407DRAFT_32414 [Tulasnella calospora MUT 4182]|uniref:BTB domain-containing protein n=1 Tax=Tulasnella calospora MUT 4182 TaxID=1051891 RepID=A0A0C3PT21_9AGAM|nr:hypothetical protein M407DRAFT_32414 [Tulasnella calospora MUT 4182]
MAAGQNSNRIFTPSPTSLLSLFTMLFSALPPSSPAPNDEKLSSTLGPPSGPLPTPATETPAAEASQPNTQPHGPFRNPNWYIPYGDVAGDQLFRIGSFPLRFHSSIFNDLFNLPASNQDHGCSDASPVRLSSPLLSAATVELLLNWIFRVPNTPTSAEEAISLLKVADFLNMELLHTAMSDFLTALPSSALSPSTRIHISRHHHLTNQPYLEAAFTEILRGRIRSLSITDHINLGPDIMTCLSSVFEAMTEHRARLCANVPPAQHDAEACTGQIRKDCNTAWKRWWQVSVVEEGFQNPNQRPWSGQEIVSKLKITSTVHPWGMSWQCSDRTMKALSVPPLSTVIFGDDTIIKHALPILVGLILPLASTA